MYFKHYYYYCPISLEVFQKKLFSSSLGEILYLRACLVLAVDQHVFQVFLAGNMYQKGEGVLAILFTGYPPMPIHCSNLFQKYSIEKHSYLKTEVLLQQHKLRSKFFYSLENMKGETVHR